MERNRVEELIEKYNAGGADASEINLLVQLIESGEVLLEQLADVAALHTAINRIDEGAPTLRLDDQFYAMLKQEKAKQKRFSFQLPSWSVLMPRLAFAASFTILGFFSAYVFVNRTATPEVQQLTQEVSDLKEMMMLSLLEKESATERLRAVSLTSQMVVASNNVTAALIKTLNHDENINVRLAALDALKPYVTDTTVRIALVQSIGQQQSPLMQVALAELMAAIQEKKSLQEFEKILKGERTPEEVKKRIKENLKVIV
jgi:hypothetical protein